MKTIERVARAICATGFDGHDPDEMITHKCPADWDAFTKEVPQGYREDGEYWDIEDGETVCAWKRWRSYVPQARAAIEAMSDIGARDDT